jgi:hypothetical protein
VEDPDLWLSCFWAGYYSTLPEKKQRELFMSSLPDATAHRSALYMAHVGQDIPDDYDPARAFKAASQSRLTAERELERAKGAEEAEGNRVREIGTRIRDMDAQGITKPTEDLGALHEDILRFSQQANDEQVKADKHAEWQTKMDLAEREKAQNAKILEAKSNLPDVEKFEKECDSLQTDLTAERNTARTHNEWEQAVDTYNRAIEHNSKVLKEDERIMADLELCPTCKRDIIKGAPDEKDTKKAILENAGNSRPLMTTVDPGPEPTKPDHDKIPKLDSDLQKARQALSDARAEHRAMNGTQPVAIVDPGPEPDKGDMVKAQRLIEQVEALKARVRDVEARQAALEDVSADELKRAQEAHEAADKLVSEAQAKLDDARKLEDALHPQKGIEQQVLAWQLSQAFENDPAIAELGTNVEFRLVEYQKTTGNEMPVFRIMAKIANREDRGAYFPVPLRYASAGQQIWIGTQIAHFLNQANKGVCDMRWFDNADLLSADLPRVMGLQVFEARVTNDTGEPKIIDANPADVPHGTPQEASA